MLTSVKVILCDSMLNILHVSILYDRQGHDNLLTRISWVKPLREPEVGPTSKSHLKSLRPCLDNTLASTPKEPILEHHCFTTWKHMARSLISFNLRSVRRTPVRRSLLLKSDFTSEELIFFLLEEVKLVRVILSHGACLLPPFARESTTGASARLG